MPTEPRDNPPIVHPAGVIPPEVEQAVAERIEARKTAEAAVEFATQSGVDLDEWQQEVVLAAYENRDGRWLPRLTRRWGLWLGLAGIRTASSPPAGLLPGTVHSAQSDAPAGLARLGRDRSASAPATGDARDGSETDAPPPRTGRDPARPGATRRSTRTDPSADRNPEDHHGC